MPEDFEIRGADGTQIKVPAGRYYFNTKARCERMCKNSLSSEARQVYAALELLTMGWQREEAKFGNEWATRSHLAQMTGLDEANVRRGLVELEREGLAKREPIDPKAPLQKGNIKILSWATPQPVKEEIWESRATPIYLTLRPEWKPLQNLINRLKLNRLPGFSQESFEAALDSQPEEVDRIARNLQTAEEEAARFTERVCALERTNKEERTERTSERTLSSAAAAAQSEEQPPQPQQPPPPESPNGSDWEPVYDLICDLDKDASTPEITQFVADCRKARSDITPEDLSALIGNFNLSSAQSAFRVLRSRIPPLLRDDRRWAAFKRDPKPVRFDNKPKKEFTYEIVGGLRD